MAAAAFVTLKWVVGTVRAVRLDMSLSGWPCSQTVGIWAILAARRVVRNDGGRGHLFGGVRWSIAFCVVGVSLGVWRMVRMGQDIPCDRGSLKRWPYSTVTPLPHTCAPAVLGKGTSMQLGLEGARGPLVDVTHACAPLSKQLTMRCEQYSHRLHPCSTRMAQSVGSAFPRSGVLSLDTIPVYNYS